MDETVRYVNTRQYVGILEELAQEGREVGVPIAGNSMAPFLISGRDHAVFRKPDRPLRTGDMVFFRRTSGEYILHRIRKKRKDGYYIIGDAQTQEEGPVRADQIFGLVTKVRRKGEWIDDTDLWWRFFATVWIRMIPARPFLKNVYGWIHPS